MSSTALAAVFAASSLAPVMTVQAAESLEVKDIIVSKDGDNFTVTQSQYNSLVALGKNLDLNINHIQVAGNLYKYSDFNAAIATSGNVASALELLSTSGTAQTNVTSSPAEFDGNGNLVVTPVAGELKVESVMAINATTVEVKFNTAVDVADAADANNGGAAGNLTKYSIGGSSNTPSDVLLSEDGKIATLTFATSIEGENLAVVVDPITTKADDNVKTERYANTLTYKDTVKPTVTSIESISGGAAATTASIKFSEQVDLTNSIVKLNGAQITPPALEADNKTLNLVGLDLNPAETHTLEIVNLEDLATNANITAYVNKTFKVTVDTQAPALESIEAKSDTTLLFTFSKPVVTPLKANVQVVDKNLVDKKTVVFGAADFVLVSNSNNTQFEVAIDDVADLLPAGTNTNGLTFRFDDKKVVDMQGNKLPAVTKTVTLTRDTVKPSITNVNYRTNAKGEVKELVFKLSEDVTLASALTGTSLTALLKDEAINFENGVAANLATSLGAINVTNWSVADNVVTVKITPKAMSGKYTFEAKKDVFEDLAETTNKNNKHSFTLDFGAKKVEETFKVTSATETDSNNVTTIDVLFAEPVKGGSGANSATSLSAYKLNGKALPVGTTIVLDTAQTTATITLPLGTIKDSDDAAIFVADSIVSKDGKKNLEKFTDTVKIIDNIAPELTSAVLTADNNLLVTFSEAVTPDDADFELEINGTTVTQADFSTTAVMMPASGSDAGKFIIKLADLVVFSTDTKVVLAAGDITIATGSDVTGSFKYATSPVIDTITLSTIASPTPTVDGESNKLVGGKKIVIK